MTRPKIPREQKESQLRGSSVAERNRGGGFSLDLRVRDHSQGWREWNASKKERRSEKGEKDKRHRRERSREGDEIYWGERGQGCEKEIGEKSDIE